MRIISIAILLLSLQGCVGTVVTMSCAANSGQLPEKEKYTLNFSATVSTNVKTETKSTELICTYKERTCGGGDWFFKWDQQSEKHLHFDLGSSKDLNVNVPNCYMALRSLKEATTHTVVPVTHGDSIIVSNDQTFSVYNSQLLKSEAKNVYGVSFTNLTVSETNAQ